MVYNLTANDLTLRYSDVAGGAYASLSLSMKELFKNMGRVKVNINLDLVATFGSPAFCLSVRIKLSPLSILLPHK